MEYTKKTRINVRTIRHIPEGGGLTLRHGKPISYSYGWQVGIHGVECHTPEEVSKVIHSGEFRESCGIWYENGIYYVDHCVHVTTKKEAIALGRQHGQLSVYSWERKKMNPVLWL
jgi:hypothetical protein